MSRPAARACFARGAAVIIAAAMASPLCAQSVPELKDALRKIEQPDAKVVEADRRKALAGADDLRAKLLAAAPDDEHAATWLADRAAFALDQAGAGGLDVVVLLGVATREQDEQAIAIGERALDLLTRADAAAAQAVARLESRLLSRDQPPTPEVVRDIEQRLKRLVDLEQARRIPYLRALARTLIAGATADAAQRQQLASDAVRALKDLPAPTPALAASRHAALGLALVQADVGERAEDILKAAGDQFALALQQTSGLDQGLKVRAALGLVRAGRQTALDQIDANPSVQAELEQLALEARAALDLARSRRPNARRIDLTSSAIKHLLASAPTPEAVSLGATDRRPAVYQKIAEAVGRDVPLKLLPSEAAFARAITLARQTGLADAPARSEALGLLRTVVDRADTLPGLRAQARWESAVIVAASGDQTRELEALGEVFIKEPASEYALPAARRVFEALARRSQSREAMTDAWRRLMPLKAAALDTLIHLDPSDVWRQEGVRQALAELETAASLEAVAGAALSHVEAMQAPQTQAASRATINDAVYRAVGRAQQEPNAGKLDTARALELARQGVAYARAHDAQRLPEYTLVLGEAQLMWGGKDADVLATLKQLAEGPVDHPDSPLWARYRFALAEALQRSEDGAGAFATLRVVADHFEAEPGVATRRGEYWLAWARMLEIQQGMNVAGARSDDVLVQVRRLELIDPALGGPSTASRIRGVAEKAKLSRPVEPVTAPGQP